MAARSLRNARVMCDLSGRARGIVCSVSSKHRQRAMAHSLSATEEEMLEPCIEGLDELTDALPQFPDAVIAHAFRAHLAALLSVLLEREVWTYDEARAFLTALEEDVLR